MVEFIPVRWTFILVPCAWIIHSASSPRVSSPGWIPKHLCLRYCSRCVYTWFTCILSLGKPGRSCKCISCTERELVLNVVTSRSVEWGGLLAWAPLCHEDPLVCVPSYLRKFFLFFFFFGRMCEFRMAKCAVTTEENTQLSPGGAGVFKVCTVREKYPSSLW